VLAIIITIMVLELKPPHDSGWSVLRTLAPTFWSYVLSFLYVGIYWNNRVLSAAVRKSETAALRHPIVPVANGLIS
jgi:uncharacterized membrane protein